MKAGFKKIKSRDVAEAVECMDALVDRWTTAWMLAGMLELSRHAPELDPEIIGEAGSLLVEELEKMRSLLGQLEKWRTRF